jgi:hypothetical protein
LERNRTLTQNKGKCVKIRCIRLDSLPLKTDVSKIN